MEFENIRVDDVIKLEYPSGDFKQFKVIEVNTFAKYVAGTDLLIYRAEFNDENINVELIHREQTPLPTKRFALIVPIDDDGFTGIWLNSSGEWLNDSGSRVTEEQALEWLNSGDYKIVFEGDVELDSVILEW